MLYLDIHYSDFWADPQNQGIPAAWKGQDLSQLTTTVQNYTQQVISAFAAQGTPVDMASIGNEIRNGILWPVGQVDSTTDTGWNNLTTLLKAGVAGARGQPTRYGKPVVIAESQYPWTLAGGDSTGNFVWEASHVSDGYPATPGGQLSFCNDMLSILAQVPNGLGMGVFYWEPEWIPRVGWEPGAGAPNDNLTLFSFTGQALPSVGLFQSPLAVCAHYDPSARCPTARARDRRPN